MWGRMAAAAVTRGTPGGKSQGLLPASPPLRQGAQLYWVPTWSTAPGTTVLSPPSSPLPPCFRPPPPRQGAQLRAGPHRGPACAGDSPGEPRTGHPHCPSPVSHSQTLLRGFSRTSRCAGGTLPPQTFSWDPLYLYRGISERRASDSSAAPGPAAQIPLCTLAGCLVGIAHLCPGAESLPQPQLHCT